MPRRIGLAAASTCLVPLACAFGVPAAQAQAVGQPYTGSMEIHSSPCSTHVTMPARFVRFGSMSYEYQAAYVGPGGFVDRNDPLVGADVRFLISRPNLLGRPSVTEDVLVGGSAAGRSSTTGPRRSGPTRTGFSTSRAASTRPALLGTASTATRAAS